jgi:hypothetical protein
VLGFADGGHDGAVGAVVGELAAVGHLVSTLFTPIIIITAKRYTY